MNRNVINLGQSPFDKHEMNHAASVIKKRPNNNYTFILKEFDYNYKMLFYIIKLTFCYVSLSQWPPTTKFSVYASDQPDDFYIDYIST